MPRPSALKLAQVLLLLTALHTSAAEERRRGAGRTESESEENADVAPPKKTKMALEERVSFNTEKQFSGSMTGVYGFTPEWFGVASLQYGQYPTTVPKDVERNYLGSLQAGYNTGVWGLDASYYQSLASVSKLTTRGYGGGLTFAYLPGMFEGRKERLDLLKASNRGTYQTEQRDSDEPLFWARAGVNVTDMNSTYLQSGGTASQSGLRQMGFTLDAYYPFASAFVLSGGMAIYGYSRDPAAFSTELFLSSSEEVFLIGGNVQGLPAFMAYSELAWQISPLDAFIPRLSSTMVSATKQWDVGGSLTWRRRMAEHLYFTPTYELSVLGSYSVSGFTLSLFHDF